MLQQIRIKYERERERGREREGKRKKDQWHWIGSEPIMSSFFFELYFKSVIALSFLLCPSPYRTTRNHTHQISHAIRIGNLCRSNSITKMMKPFLILNKDDDAYGLCLAQWHCGQFYFFFVSSHKGWFFYDNQYFWYFYCEKYTIYFET